MPKNSHVQLPRGILKYFKDSSGRVFYLDLATNKIGLAGAKILGTEYGYYSDENEEYLNQKIESPFTALASKVRKFLNSKNEVLTLTEEDEIALKRFITAAMLRSEIAKHSFLQSSYTASSCTDQENNDALVRIGIQLNDGILSEFRYHDMFILVNDTSVGLVIPRNCWYSISFRGHDCIVAPISPRYALCLVSQSYLERNTEERNNRIIYIKDENHVRGMNIRALSYEYSFNRAFVASASKEELEELCEFIKDNMAHLEELRENTRYTDL